MAISHTSKAYAVEDAKIAAVTADPAGGSTTYGSLIDVSGIKSVAFGTDINNVELRGDNSLLDSNATLVGVTVTFEYAKMNLDAYAVMLGGTVTDSGTGSTEVATYRRLNTNSFGYFKFEAKTPTAGADEVAGDLHIVLYKCMISGGTLFGMAEEDYQTFSVEAKALARLSDNRWFDVVLNETAAAIA